MEVSPERFEALVAEALDLIPEELSAAIENLAVSVVDRSSVCPNRLGLYEGIPLTEREHYSGMIMPDRIFIYRQAICALAKDEDEIVKQVRITVIHEIGHHFGLEDDRLEELGWG